MQANGSKILESVEIETLILVSTAH